MNENQQITSVCDFDEVSYCRFFSLLESPFGYEFDCEKFYGGGNRQSALEDLILQIRKENPFVFVRADPGSGKTAICRMVQQQLMNSLCLYVNYTGRARTISLEAQLAEGILLNVNNRLPVTEVEDALIRQLSLHQRIVVLLEGVADLSTESLLWLRSLQQKAKDLGSAIVLVFIYSKDELGELGCKLAGEVRDVVVLDPLTEYEVYEYLNDHVKRCGKRENYLFPRVVSEIIFRESAGNFATIVKLANATLRSAYRANMPHPMESDVPISQTRQQRRMSLESGAALLTARNTMFVGIVSGGLMLALIWSMFGSEKNLEPQTSADQSEMVAATTGAQTPKDIVIK